MKNFMKEFKEFISRGNVMTMAVGIIIGGAFTAIISSLVDDVIGPLIGMVLGGVDFSKIAITVGSAKLLIGNFIQAIITFILTALVIFFMMKGFNKFQKEEEEPEPETPDDVKLLEEIRDLLKEQK